MNTSRTTVEETFLIPNSSTDDTVSTKELNLAMLGCEDSDPYGPSNHTAVRRATRVDRAVRCALHASYYYFSVFSHYSPCLLLFHLL